MESLFDCVYRFLMYLSSVTGKTYFEVNIIFYYFFIPFLYCVLIDRIYRFHYLKISFAVFILASWISIVNFTLFSESLFRLSQKFLLMFGTIGVNYVTASVIWCVLVPLIVLVLLLYKVFKVKNKKSGEVKWYENK